MVGMFSIGEVGGKYDHVYLPSLRGAFSDPHDRSCGGSRTRLRGTKQSNPTLEIASSHDSPFGRIMLLAMTEQPNLIGASLILLSQFQK